MRENDQDWTNDLLRDPHGLTDKADRVRRMFNHIAPRYALVNSVFSAGCDTRWRRGAVALAAVTPEDDVLDVACGTGDFARAFARAGSRSVVGCDFAWEMLARAAGPAGGDCPSGRKSAGRGIGWENRIRWCEADALRLPFRDGTFSIVSCAFGVRNFQDVDRAFLEMNRVLRPKGRTVILEFTRPANRFIRRVYELYSNHFMPIAASWLSGDKSGAYRYLPRSVVSFQNSDDLCAALLRAGFCRVLATPQWFGIVTAYVATRD